MLASNEHSLDEVLLGLALLFALCVAVVVVFHRLKIPPVAGFLVAGALMGPHAFGLIGQPALVEQLAEVGVVVLLFTIGMELSLPELLKMRRLVLIGGGLQVLLTVLLGFGVAAVSGWGFGPSVFLGFLLALSSTAAVTKLLQEKGQLSSPSGRLGLSTCVAQDLAIVPMILMLPLLGGDEGKDVGATLLGIAQAFLYLTATAIGAWILVPRVLDLVSRTRSREVFVLTVLTLCLGAAVTTSMLGLSLALGAFLVGAVLASSGYQHQAQAEVEPFRDTLSSLFFVSIGMLFDYRVILEVPWTVVSSLAAVVLGKAAIVLLVSRVLSLPSWVGLRTALLLAQVGEFSFVLVQLGRHHELMTKSHEKVFLVVAVLSIAITPLLFAIAHRLTRAPTGSGGGEKPKVKSAMEDHVIVVGFGPVGQAVANSLQRLGVSFIVVEMNASTVKEQKSKGLPIFLGDSTREAVLHAAGIESARLVVLSIPDGGSTKRTAKLACRLNPGVHIVARSTYLGEVTALRDAGVQEIVPQELETSVEVMVRVLRHYLVPDDEVGRQVRAVRERSFGIFKSARPQQADSAKVAEFVPGLALEIFYVGVGAAVVGKSIAEIQFRKITGCTIVAVGRGSDTFISIGPDLVLGEGDVAVVIGPKDRMSDVACQFHTPDVGVTKAEVDDGAVSHPASPVD